LFHIFGGNHTKILCQVGIRYIHKYKYTARAVVHTNRRRGLYERYGPRGGPDVDVLYYNIIIKKKKKTVPCSEHAYD
jgi:hypothetical protein